MWQQLAEASAPGRSQMLPLDGKRGRKQRVNLAKLEVAVLRKYRRHFGVPSPAVAAKDELVPTLFRHFDTIEVEEEQVLGKFLNTLRERHAGVEPPPKGKGGKVARGKARGRTKK